MTVTAMKYMRSVLTLCGSEKELERARAILSEHLPDGRFPPETFDFEAVDIDIGILLLRKVAYVDHVSDIRLNSLMFVYARDLRDIEDGA